MTKYEYITIFTSIIFGLATVNILKVIAAMVHSDVKTRFYWVHTGWVFNLLSTVFLIWWDNLILNKVDSIDFFHYLDLTGYAVILYIMSSLLLPYKDKSSIDFEKLFKKNKNKFYITGLIFCLFDFFDLVLYNLSLQDKQGLPHLTFDTIILVCFVLCLVLNKKIADLLTVSVFSLGVITWFFFEIYGIGW